MSDVLERRAYLDCRIEADGARHLKGYAIRFHALSLDLGGFQEQIAPEAVDRTLRDATDVRALVDHDSGKVIGRTRAGTLTLSKDSKGLRVDIEPDTEISYARDIMRAVARGDVSGMSFGFRVLEEAWDFEEDPYLRTVLDMELREVSVVSFPAYPSTDISVAKRSLESFKRHQVGDRIAWLQKVHRTRMAR